MLRSDVIELVRKELKLLLDGEITRDDFIKNLYGDQSADHGTEHIFDVVKKGEMIHGNSLPMKEFIALTLHDIGNRVNRDTHHEEGRIISRVALLGLMDDEEGEDISMAIYTHRASSKEPLITYLQELVSSADRSIDSDDTIVKRSFEYAVNKCNLEYFDAVEHVMGHIKAKYGTGGYVRYPNLFKKFFSKDIERVTSFADSLTTGKLTSILLGLDYKGTRFSGTSRYKMKTK